MTVPVAQQIAVHPPYLAFGTPGALSDTVRHLLDLPGWSRLTETLPVLIHSHSRVRLVAYPEAMSVHQPLLDIAGYTRSGAALWSARLCAGIPDEPLLAFCQTLGALPDVTAPYQGGEHPAATALAGARWSPYLDTMDPADRSRGWGSPDGMADFSRSISPSFERSTYFWRFSAGVPGQMWSAAMSRDTPATVITALVSAMADPAPAIRNRADLVEPLPHLAPYLRLGDPPRGARADAANRTQTGQHHPRATVPTLSFPGPLRLPGRPR